MSPTDQNDKKQISRLASQVMEVTRDELLMRLRFLDGAFSRLTLTERYGLEGFAADG